MSLGTRLQEVVGSSAMVVSGHPQASSVGARILQRGGNAADASVAMAAVLAVVKPHAGGVGGDFLALHYEGGSKEVRAIHGIGKTPGGADPPALESFQAGGARAITVPGAVDGWATLSSDYGSLPFDKVLQRAITLARSGFPMYQGLARVVAKHRFRLADDPRLAALYMTASDTPRPIGANLVNSALADTLEAIASSGAQAFYHGPIARHLAARVQELGGWLDSEDLAKHASRWTQPISTDYHGRTIYEHPPPSQGFLLLEMLNLVSEDDLSKYARESHERVHLLVEAKKQAFADRDFLGDPDHCDVPIELLLDRTRALDMRAGIDPERVFTGGEVTPIPGDTTAFAVVDSGGNAVSGIQSLFRGFGSGVYVASVGVIMNDRASGFIVGEGPGSFGPNRRPPHTLTGYMVLDADGPLLVGGTPGGNGQVQTNLQVLTLILDNELSIQEAVETPRWISGGPADKSDSDHLIMESRFPAATTHALTRLGHKVSLADAFDVLMGSAKVIQRDRATGALRAGVDPRRDASAVGL